MGDPPTPTQEALKPGTDELNRRQAVSSDSDGSASIDEDDMSESGSEDYCEPTRRGGSRRIANKSPMRKRRKRPEWTRNEEETLAQVHCGVGNQWSVIAARLPGRTANEVKNIWHSTLRSKHLKARSLLRAYATALNGRWDDEAARHEAYTAALRQHAVGASEAEPSTGALEAGGLRDMAANQDDDMQTPRMGSVQAGAGAVGAQTPDSSPSPVAVLVRSRGGRGPPATAPRPLVNDRVTGRGGQHRYQHPGNPRIPPSPTSCPAKAMQGLVNQLETRSGTIPGARRNLDGALAFPSGGRVTDGGSAPGTAIMVTGLPHEHALPPATAARPLPLSFVGTWGPPLVMPQRPWPHPHPRDISDLQLQQGQRQQQEQQQQQQQQQQLQQSIPHQTHQPHNEGQVPMSVITKDELKDSSAAASPHPGSGPLLGFDPLETWIGRLDPSIMLQDDDPGAREQLCRGGADSTSSSVARAVSGPAAATAAGGPSDVPGMLQLTAANTSASGELVESGRSRLLTWPRPEQRLLGPPNTATHHGRAGPASGAWSSNSGAAGPLLQSSPPEGGGISLHHAGPQAAAPNSSTAMAISPTARGGTGGFSSGNGSAQGSGAMERLSPPAGHWHASAAAAAVHSNHERTLALPYGPPAAAVYAPPSGIIADLEGRGWAASPGGWALGAPRPPPPFLGRPVTVGLSHEAWRSELPTPQELGIRPGLHAADVRGGMYMVPVHAPPLPMPQMMYTSPQPHVPPPYLGQQHYDYFNRPQRLRQPEQIVYQQQQQYLHQQQYQQQQQEEQQQQRCHDQEQYQEQQQQTLAYQQASQRQQQCQQQFKKESQGVQMHQQLETANQNRQQHLSQHPPTNLPLALPQQQQHVQQQQQPQSSQFEQNLPTQQQPQVQQLEQHADSLSSSEVVTMGLESLQDPQLRWCLLDME